MSKKKRALFQTVATGLVVPAVVTLSKALTVTTTVPYVTIADTAAAIDGGILLGVATLAFFAAEHHRELALSDADTSLVRSASDALAEWLASRISKLETVDSTQSTSGDENADQST